MTAYRHVYVDEYVMSFGNLLYALDQINIRVFAHVHRDFETRWNELWNDVKDVKGRLCHFDDDTQRFVYHYDIVSNPPGNCFSVVNPEEEFFKYVSEFSEAKRNRILSKLRCCSGCATDNIFKSCRIVNCYADAYGVYDIEFYEDWH